MRHGHRGDGRSAEVVIGYEKRVRYRLKHGNLLAYELDVGSPRGLDLT